MIPKDIDLTIDNKFGSSLFPLFHYSNWKFQPKKKFSWSYRISPIYKLPWKNKIGEIRTFEYFKQRFEQDEDYYSHEIGFRLRTTSDNNFFKICNNFERKNWLIDSFFMDQFMIKPFSQIKTCINCGKKRIKSKNERYNFHICCKDEKIPWNRPVLFIREE